MKMRLTQEQRQIISPALMQTFELLMIPSAELTEELQQKRIENPLLKLTKPDKPKNKYRKMNQYNKFDNQSMLENTPMQDSSLYGYMKEQLVYAQFDERETTIAQLILSSLDERGFLTLPVKELLEGSDISHKEFETVRQKILELEPIGIGSYNIMEYLKIQIVEHYGKKSPEYRILDEFSDLLEKKQFSKIAKKLDASYEEVVSAVENIGKLNFNPGAQFSQSITHYVTPDATVTVSDDGIQVTLHDDYLPEVNLNDEYLDNVYQKSKLEAVKSAIFKQTRQLSESHFSALGTKYQKTLSEGMEGIVFQQLKDIFIGKASLNSSKLERFPEIFTTEIRNLLEKRKSLWEARHDGLNPYDAVTEEVIAEIAKGLSAFIKSEMMPLLQKNGREFLDKGTKEFLNAKKNEVNTLIENLRSRKEIIFKVIYKIIEIQREYFLKGAEYLVPLKLKNIADELNIHESTVSRVVKDKYIQTDKGIMSLKSFFSTNVGPNDTSSGSIKDTLKKIIEAEDRDDPLSDDKIVKILKNKGIAISRRTVAKYRDQLHIPAAFMRKNPV